MQKEHKRMNGSYHKIVLVDDDMATLDQGKMLLQDFYKVYTVQSAAILFENLEIDIPDLILLDVAMPDIDGFDTIKMLKADNRYKDIPVIFLTAKSDEESERKGFSLGAVDYITKPFSGPLLQKRISNQILYMRVQNAVKDYSHDLEVVLGELNKADERAILMLDTSPICAQIWDKSLEIIDCNEAAVKLFGFEGKQEYIDDYLKRCSPVYQPDGQRSEEKILENVKKAFEEGRCSFEWIHQMPADGMPFPAEVTLVKAEHSKEEVVIGYIRDLREHKRMMTEIHEREVELIRARAEAETANDAKSIFLANMSHEIRTPMNSIIGFAELTKQEDIPQKNRKYLKDISESATWLIKVIDDILDISKIEAGKTVLEFVPFNLQDVFSNCRSAVVTKAEEKGILLYCYAEPVTDKKLIGDPIRLNQVIVNLLSNAVKFTNVGTVKLLAFISNLQDDSVTISFEIKDSGIGMDAEQIERIFRPFAQADESVNKIYGGTGLGLTITSSLVELMGGRLEAESKVGIGSKFSFSLTFDLVEDASDTSPQEVLFLNHQRPIFSGEVLICEDNVMNQKLICDHLATVGLLTHVVQTGKEGVDIVAERIENGEKPFDLIFMDIHMPVMDGLEAASKIIELGSKTPIVALTANIMTDALEHYKSTGMKDILGKPFKTQELWACLMKFLSVTGITTVDVQKEQTKAEKDKRQLRSYFVRNNQTTYGLIVEAMEAEDIDLAKRLVHTLKGNAGQIKEKKLQKAAEVVEEALSEGGNSLNDDLMNSLENELNSVLKKLSPMIQDKSSDEPIVIDAKRKAELIEQLEPMLIDFNTECYDLLDEIRQIPEMKKLARHVEVLNFKGAIAELSILKKKAE